MSPFGRRELLADAAGGLLLCTLGGQKVLSSKKADVESLSAEIAVPPKTMVQPWCKAAHSASAGPSALVEIMTPPNRPMEMAVVRIIATVMVTLRRSPVKTSLSRKPKRT